MQRGYKQLLMSGALNVVSGVASSAVNYAAVFDGENQPAAGGGAAVVPVGAQDAEQE